ncbi:MAG: 1-deoxy-D-xylulose-5-phosphate reductoisomerase [Dethiobacter sp.]|jgi:1-deoxy-D-xylulose-5-phosphate reductoisomerase|nr:1-deoxy-D-xylulose-5-phosphate reductoisomerase [Dethiobacter sp.]MBS3900652.1 1-deoxy-D-xylulose-5-phosphate reductoisomerase [Dethiobacter sp.]MBS3989626.1 1-deoxy-D-xylulose-5-phosphate reductoisomerase [Dethiobacter sp.]
MKRITLLGSTGSIGTQALQVVASYPERFRIHSLSAHRQTAMLARQARRFLPAVVAISDESCYNELKAELSGLSIKILAGPDSLRELAADQETDIVLNSLVGFAGLAATLAALSAGNTLALANKESLVAGGQLAMHQAAKAGVTIFPVDSEHSAIFQCLQGQQADAVEKIVLTASGGPFFGRDLPFLQTVTPQDALKHPNWEMGPKITVDSATMMNKGLEVIEARWLFNIPYEKIEVVVHRESIVHSLVAYRDGSVLAQLGAPDMRVPIQYALTYPERLPGHAPRLCWNTLSTLNFAPPDKSNFPCLPLAYWAGAIGGSMPCVLNAANEEAVRLFLGGKARFLEIPRIIERVMNKHKVVAAPDFDILHDVDKEARLLAQEYAGMKG